MKNIPLMLLCLFPLLLLAANFENLPTPVEQPDGTVLSLLASGDEYANRLHDAQGYSIIQSPSDGYYYYAVLQNGEPVPSVWRADASDPRALGLTPGINISPASYRAKVQFMNDHARKGSRGPNNGTVNNLVVYIKFSDQTEFPDPRSVYDAKFNDPGTQAYSLRNYFHQASYNQLDYISYHYPQCAPELNLSYQDSHPRAYYMPYNQVTNPQGYRDWQRTEREHTLLADAIAAIAPEVPVDLNIDADNDGYVDNVCFIIRGPHTAWADLLWAHRWALYTENAFINGKQVWDFTFQPENHNSVRTLCHEMFHSAGAPDLYHYQSDGVTPAGCWDIMESGNGHMGMHMKARYGEWIAPIPEIGAGVYTLNPVTSPVNNAYRIPLTNDEYLVLEYRKQGADIYEADLPGSGLLIYRINTTLAGNADGPPDEVYIYRPNGSQTVNGLIAEASFSQDEFRTEFNQLTNPSCFLTSGIPGSVNIQNITTAGETISFTVVTATGSLPPVISALTPVDGAILTPGDCTITAAVSDQDGTVNAVEFYLDGLLLGSASTAPYAWTVSAAQLNAGYHDILARATSSTTLTSTRHARIRVVDPQQQTWFSWLSDTPVWGEYGRGAVPIKVALDMDLGTQEYLVKKIAFNAVSDPWGLPVVPGLVNAKINRFAGGAITEQTLLSLGDLTHPMTGRYEYTVDSTVPISGQIAVILDLFEYQNIVFDLSADCGHSWFTEPNRPWTDALGRGILGAADIELLLQSPNVASAELVNPVPIAALRNYPNPFSTQTGISFSLKSPQLVELCIFNIKGQKVRELFRSDLPAGNHNIDWDGRDQSGRLLGSGIYLCSLKVGSHQLVSRMAVIK